MPPFDQYLSPQAQQAVIAGLFLAIGWWVVALQNRRRDANLRAERVRDVQRAVFAEIRAYLAVLKRDNVGEYGARIKDRILTEKGFFPVIPTEHNDAVFRAIIGDIHVLPRDTVDPVVLYYSQLNAIAAMISDLRELDVAKIGAERAAGMYHDYISMKIEALELGEQALEAIGANLNGRGKSYRKTINNPASGRFGQ
ncbi:hypothetical protein [Paracoccus fontiphilus]|uniref:Uncharacterized protein n=1 Tax=Paracoccus fontiphilus TaxID=1815556 RepID=A0ABV7IDZ5_9RHOB|nr:hypothetical protein [Paracoccus fontiphilus]